MHDHVLYPDPSPDSSIFQSHVNKDNCSYFFLYVKMLFSEKAVYVGLKFDVLDVERSVIKLWQLITFNLVYISSC